MIGFALLTHNSYNREREQLERDTVQTARALALALDRDFGRGKSAALALAGSPYLQKHDFAAFHAQAKSLLGDGFPGANFVLSDESGQQIVNTFIPFGDALPRHGNPEQLRQVFATGKPLISDIYIGGVTRRPIISIDVPVWLDGRVAYDLSVGILPEQLGRILTEQRLPPDRIVAIYDTKGVIAVRSHFPENFVGKPGAPAILRLLQEMDEGFAPMNTLDGVPIYSSFSRSAETRWAVAIGIPQRIFVTDLLQSLTYIVLVVLGLLCVGFGTALVLGARIGGSMRALNAAAVALGLGRTVSPPPMYFREADEVAESMVKAEELIRRRTVERDLAVAAENERAESERRLVEMNRKLEATTQQLARSNAELAQFAYVASHDLREPLRMVSSYLGLIGRRLPPELLSDDIKEFMGFAVNGAQRMERLILDLLEFSRTGRTGEPTEVALGTVMAEALVNLMAAVKDADAEIVVADNLPVVKGDATELIRLFQNLIGNAVKYRAPDRHAKIEIDCRREGGEWLVSVKDNGIGIPPEDYERAFGIFQRLVPHDAYEGTGIGLAICKKIVEHHGGRIWIESEVGVGSTFFLTLPA